MTLFSIRLRPAGLCLLILAFTLPGTLSLGLEEQERREEVHAEVGRLFDFEIYGESARMLEAHLEQDPGDLRARRLLARAYLELDEFARLAEQARLILERDPEDERAEEWLALAEQELEALFPETLAELEAAVEEEPDNTPLRLRLIEFLETHDEVDLAINQYEELIRRNPEQEAFLLRFARFLAISGRNQEAYLYYRHYLEEDPDPRIRNEMFDVLLRSANDMVEEGREDEAESMFRNIIDQFPDDSALVLQYARFLSQVDRFSESAEVYRELVEEVDPLEDPEFYSTLRFEYASVLAWAGRGGASAAVLRDILAEDPENLDAVVLLGDLHRWFDDTDAARGYYEDVLAEDPDHPGALRGLRELDEMMELRRAQAESLSIPAMEQRLKEDPEDQEARLQLTRLYTAASRYRDANELFVEYLRRDPDAGAVRRAYAFSLSMIEEYDEAIRQLRIYLRDHPEDLSSRLRIATMLMWQGEFRAAEREFLDILPEDPENPEIHWNLGRIYQLREEWERALHHYRQIQREAPSFRVAQTRIAQIQNHPRYRLLVLQQRAEEDPEDISAHLELARVFLDLERYAEARSSAGAVLRRRPGHTEAERLAEEADEGLIRFRTQRIRQLRRDLRDDPENIALIIELSRLLAAEERYDEARRFFVRYLEERPEDMEARREYARILIWLPEHRSEALRQMETLLEADPESRLLQVELLELAGQVEELEGEMLDRYRALESELRENLEFDPGDIRSLYLLARLRQANGEWIAARDTFEQVVELDADYEDAEERLDNLLQDIRYQIALLEREVRLNPSLAEPRLELARTLYENGLYFRAREVAREVLEIEPRQGEAIRMIRSATERMERTRAERMRVLRQVLLEEPRNMNAQLEYARLLKEEEEVEEAIRRFRIYLRANPNDWEARRDYAEMLSWYGRYLDQGVYEFRQLAEFYPENAELRKQYAQVLVWGRHFWPEAEQVLADLMIDQPGDLDVMLMLADLYRFQGRYGEARKLYEEILRMEPPEQRPRPDPRLMDRRPARRGPVDPDMIPSLVRDREREVRPVVQRTAAIEPIDARFTGRVAPVPQERVIVLPEFETNFEQARRGLREMNNLLRPQLFGQIAYLEDNEDYSEFFMSARYNYFLRDGTQLHVQLAMNEYSEDGVEESSVTASTLQVGLASRVGPRSSGAVEVYYTDYDSNLGSSLSGNLRGSYDFTPTYTWSLEYSKFDVIRDVNTVRSLVEDIDADRITVSVASNPPPSVEDFEFLDRIFFDGFFSYAAFSDNNRQTAFLARPYYRVMDQPILDIAVGWRGLDYSQSSPFYFSPSNYQGPLFAARLAGETLWDVNYDVTFQSFFPRGFGGPSRSLSLTGQRTILENLDGGVNLSLSESPRQDDFRYQFWAVLFDLLLRF